MDLASNASEVLSHPPNDYYPLGTAIPGYVANEATMAEILTVFFGTCAVLFGGTHFVSKRLQPDLTRTELFTLLWFILSGCIHIFFEGYYVMNVLDIGTHQTWIGQMWKEYAFSDSRYLTQDAFVLCMESITAIAWGPGCLLVAAMVLTRHPLRFPLQALVSLGQVYGDVLYYGTAYFEHVVYGLSYSRPEPFYFYFYFIFMNAIWMVIPGGKFREQAELLGAQREGSGRSFQADLSFSSNLPERRPICRRLSHRAAPGGFQEDEVIDRHTNSEQIYTHVMGGKGTIHCLAASKSMGGLGCLVSLRFSVGAVE